MGNSNQLSIAIVGDNSHVTQVLQQTIGSVQGFVNQISQSFLSLQNPIVQLAGALKGGEAMKNLVQDSVDWTVQSQKLTRVLGTTNQESMQLAVAIGNIHGNVEDFLGGAQKLVRTLNSNEKAIQSIGVQTRDTNGHFRSAPVLIADINAKLGQYREGIDRDAAAQKVYGKSWQEMLRYIKLTPAVMEEAREEAERLHLLVGKEGVERTNAYREGIRRADLTLESFKIRIGNELLPTLTDLAAWFSRVGPAAIDVMIRAAHGLASALHEPAIQIGLVGAAIYGLGKVDAVVKLLGVLSAAFKTLTLNVITFRAVAASTGIWSAITMGIQAMGSAIYAALGPWGLLLAALAGGAWAVSHFATKSTEAALEIAQASLRQAESAKASATSFNDLASRAEGLEKQLKQTAAGTREHDQAKRQLNVTVKEMLGIYPDMISCLHKEAGGYIDVTRSMEEYRKKKIQNLEADIQEARGRLQEANNERVETAGSGFWSFNRDYNPISYLLYQRANLANADATVEARAKEVKELERALEILKGQAELRYDGEGDHEKKPKRNIYQEEMNRLQAESLKLRADGSKEVAEEIKLLEISKNLEKEKLKIAHDVKEGSTTKAEGAKLAAQAEANAGLARVQALKKAASERMAMAAKAHSEEIEEEKDHLLAGLSLQEEGVRGQRDLGRISAEQELAALRALEQEKFDIEYDALQAQLALAKEGTEEEEKLFAKLAKLKDSHASKEQGFQIQGARLSQERTDQNTVKGGLKSYINETRQSLQQWGTLAKGIMQGVESAFANGIKGILSGQMTLGQGLKAIWSGIADTIITALAQIAAKYLTAAIANAIFRESQQEAAGAAAGAALIQASAETWAAYAGIPWIGAAMAMAQLAVMNASMVAQAGVASGIMAFADGGIMDRPTLGLFAEAGQRELAVPEVTFLDWAGNLTRNILAQERQTQGYHAQAAGYAMAAQQQGRRNVSSGQAFAGGASSPSAVFPHAVIFTANSREMQNFLAGANRGYDKRNG